MKEYIIWGKRSHQHKDEEILLTKIEGKLITDRREALKGLYIIKTKYNCVECRIQEVNLNCPESINNLFKEAIK